MFFVAFSAPASMMCGLQKAIIFLIIACVMLYVNLLLLRFSLLQPGLGTLTKNLKWLGG